ncbi:MAG TPA: hypothetical protein VFP86_20255, partial [bacterium]|nr:hypothetical protein [bacterium]
LPVAVIGTDTVFPKGARRLSRGTIRVRVAAPIRIDGLTSGSAAGRADRERIATVGRQFMDVIAHLLDDARTA